MAKIEVRNLTKIFGNNPQKALKLLDEGYSKDEILKKSGQAVGVNKASFEAEEGETFVVMGLSGSGKSTLIRCLNLLIKPTDGTIVIDGDDITKLSDEKIREFRREKQSMVFQRFALLPHRTIIENAAFGLEVRKIDKEEREERARKTLEIVGLDGWEDRYPSQLSGGMQQRVGLARALTVDPEILLMDEAFSALDPLIRREMQDELLDLQEKMNKTIIFITHDLDEALKIGDRVALMKDGMIVQIGTPEEILTSPANEYVSKFVEDVDLSKVLTADGIMSDPGVTALPKDGPRVVLRRMREKGISSIFVVDRNRRLQGYVLAEEAGQAAERGDNDIQNIIREDVTTVPPDRTLNDLFEDAANATVPLVVVDEDNKIKGIIVRGAVLGGLTRQTVEDTEEEDTGSANNDDDSVEKETTDYVG